MDIRKLQRAIVDGLEDVKAQDIQVFNTEHLSPLFERVIIASGTSNRQTKALAASVRDAVKSEGLPVMRTEGEENGEWIIVDCGAAVCHIMQPTIRQYYHLEEIWGGKPVKIKLGGEARGLVKASEPVDGADEEPARKATSKAAAGTSPAAKAPAKKAAAKKAAAKVAGKTAGSGRSVGAGAKTAGMKKPAAKKTAPKTASRTAGQAAPAKTAARKSSTGAAPAAEKAVRSGTAPARKAAATRAPAKTASRAPAKAPARPAGGAAAARKTAVRKTTR
ncbi:MAG: ribosome silencing factor [Pseudomonadota bacterium]